MWLGRAPQDLASVRQELLGQYNGVTISAAAARYSTHLKNCPWGHTVLCLGAYVKLWHPRLCQSSSEAHLQLLHLTKGEEKADADGRLMLSDVGSDAAYLPLQRVDVLLLT
jgi:hypothetical protein